MKAQASGRHLGSSDDDEDEVSSADNAEPKDPFFQQEADPFNDPFFQVHLCALALFLLLLLLFLVLPTRTPPNGSHRVASFPFLSSSLWDCRSKAFQCSIEGSYGQKELRGLKTCMQANHACNPEDRTRCCGCPASTAR